MEVSYINVPANQQNNREEPKQNCHSGRSKIFGLVGISFVLLCIVQSILNATIQTDEWTDSSSTNNFTRDLILERDELLQERNQLLQEKDRLLQERDKLSQEKNKLSQEKDQLLQEKNKLSQEKNKLSQEKNKLSQEKNKLSREKNKLSQEKNKLSREKNKLSQEKDRLTQNMRRLEDSNRQLTTDNNMLNEKISKLEKQIQELETKEIGTPNTQCCPVGWQAYKNSCYQLSSTSDTWDYADSDCRSKGAHLVTFSNEMEERVATYFGHDHKMWVGLKGPQYTLRWTWVDGSPLQGYQIQGCGCGYVDPYVHAGLFLGDCDCEFNYWMCEMDR